FNPVFDNGPGGYGHDRVKAYWRGFSPLHNITPGAPPTVLLFGTRDKLVPVSTVRRYERLMHGVDARCDVHLYEGQGHGFFNRGRPAYAETLAAVEGFLESVGYLEAPAPAAP
ncbi:MAG: dienelactone hydrolase family protein, partial [Planctomycetota bacterium]